MISDRAKRLVEALKDWRSLEQAYEVAQRFLDEERIDARVDAARGMEILYDVVPLSEKIAQTRGQNGETE